MDGSLDKQSWITVAAAFTINFLGDGFIFSFGVLFVELLDTFQQSRATTVLVGSTMNGCAHLIGPIAGPICDAGGSRGVAIVGSLLSALGLLASSYATSVVVLYASFGVVCGAGIGLMISAANACVLKHFTTSRALASGIAVSGTGAGTFVMNQLIVYLIELYGWRGAILVVSGLLLNGLVCGLLITESRQSTGTCNVDTQPQRKPQSGLKQQLNHHVDTYKKVLKTIMDFTLLRDIHCIFFLLSSVSANLAISIPFSFLPAQASEYGIPDIKASWLVSSIGITNTFSRVLLGVLADRQFVNRLCMLESLMILTGISLALSPLLVTFETKLIFTLSYGFCLGGYVMLVPVVLTDLFGSINIGKSFGLNRFAIGVTALTAPAIVGWILDQGGSYTLVFLLAGVEFIIAGAFLMLLFILSRRSQRVYSVNL